MQDSSPVITRNASVVLIVDDEAQNRRVLGRQLAEEGFTVIEASNGREALELLATQRVDAILLDVVMPGMDGIEVTRHLKQRPELREIPVIVLTGTEDTRVRMAALDAGAEEYLTRPVETLEMRARLRNLLRLREAALKVKEQNVQLVALLAEQSASVARHEQALRDTVVKLEESQLQMIQAQKMESIGRLAGGVAHDFNNILTSIICFTRFVVDDMAASDPRRADLMEVLKSADSAAKLTNQLLAFSRRRPAQPMVIDLNAALTSVDRVLRRTLGEQVEVVILPAEEPMCATIDASQLDQLIFNLAVNARDAMPRGGTLMLRLGRQTIGERDALAAGDYVELIVSDTGQGMAPDVLARVFDPFFTTKGDKGTGLGLATCYGIVAQAQGRITVHSVVGEGTSFSVLLPRLADATADDKRRSLGYDELGLRGTVLIVEDQPAILRTMTRAFESAGMATITAQSAEDALAMLRTQATTIDLLATDIILPGMSGIHLVEKLREEQPALRVLFVSGYAGDDPTQTVRTDERTGFVAKPFTGRQLVLRAALLFGTPSIEPPVE